MARLMHAGGRSGIRTQLPPGVRPGVLPEAPSAQIWSRRTGSVCDQGLPG